jgi:hypothetical protein
VYRNPLPSTSVGWVERSEIHRLSKCCRDVMGFTSFNPSYGCAAFAQFRARIRAELLGMTSYAMVRPSQLISWSLLSGAIYAAIIARLFGFIL